MGLRSHRRSAFTLIELMVVMAIIMILAGLILAAAWNSRQKALQTYCLNNIRQLAVSEVGGGIGQEGVGTCPAGCQYASNRYVNAASDASNPSGTVLLFESESGGSGTEADVVKRHLGGANFAFCDGHAKWSKETPNFRP